jgi:hypothetical protein
MIRIIIRKYQEPKPEKKGGFFSFFSRTKKCVKPSKEELRRQQEIDDRNSLIAIGTVAALAAVAIITGGIVEAKNK